MIVEQKVNLKRLRRSVKKYIALAEYYFEPDNLKLSGVLNGLAMLYKYMGNFDDSERLYKRLLTNTQQSLCKDHLNLAVIYHNLGGLEHARGNYQLGLLY